MNKRLSTKLPTEPSGMQAPVGSATLRCSLTIRMLNANGRTLLIAGTIGVFLLFLARNFANLEAGIDFPDFYCAGVMARQEVNLYDPAMQQRCQMREASRTGTYYIHPPFEALAFAPLVSLSVKQAYLAWNLMGCLLLVLTWRTLANTLQWKFDWGVLFAVGLLFPPLLLNFVQGQDSALLIALVVFAFTAWDRQRFVLAGALLGLGLFKFHLIVPLALLLSIHGRGRFAAGFVSVGAALAEISGTFFGWGVFEKYIHFLRTLPQLPMSGVHWQAMANVRGLVTFLTGPDGRSQIFYTAIASSILLLGGAWTWLRAGDSRELQHLAWSGSVLTAILVGYHLSPHDLTLLLLPMVLLIGTTQERTGRARWISTVIVAICFLPPIHLLLLSSKYYALMSLAVVTLALLTLQEFLRVASRRGLSIASAP
jgi:hypothetical protein